jgi:hypothetical protein
LLPFVQGAAFASRQRQLPVEPAVWIASIKIDIETKQLRGAATGDCRSSILISEI